MTPAVFKRTALVRCQALKFVPEYRAAYKGLVEKYRDRPQALARAKRELREGLKATDKEPHRDLLALAARFPLPTRVPVDPDDLADLPLVPADAVPPVGTWEFETMGVEYVGAGTLIRLTEPVLVDLDMRMTSRELLEGLRMLRKKRKAHSTPQPEQFGVSPLSLQPELVAPGAIRVAVDLDFPDKSLEKALALLRNRWKPPTAPSEPVGARGETDGTMSTRRLRGRPWQGALGWKRAFEVLRFHHDNPKWSTEDLARRSDQDWWNDPTNLPKRATRTKRTSELLRAAEKEVEAVAGEIAEANELRERIRKMRGKGATLRRTSREEAEVLFTRALQWEASLPRDDWPEILILAPKSSRRALVLEMPTHAG